MNSTLTLIKTPSLSTEKRRIVKTVSDHEGALIRNLFGVAFASTW